MQIFALDASKSLGERIAEHLEISLSPHEERYFEDGEHKFRPLVSVKGNDVYVVLSLFGAPENSVNDKLIKLLFFLGALRDAFASETGNRARPKMLANASTNR